MILPFAFYERLAPRERTLLILVAATVFALGNVLAVTSLAGAIGTMRRQCADESMDLKAQEIFAGDQPKWDKRKTWLHATQPPLISRDRAGAALLEQVQAVGRGSQVLITNPQIRPLPVAGDGRSKVSEFQPVTVEVETQSDWSALVKFIAGMQRPDGFVVFDLATVRSDPTDPTRIRGQFRISKWYAPAGR